MKYARCFFIFSELWKMTQAQFLKCKIICKVSNEIKLLKILILSPKCYHQKKNMIFFKKKKSPTLSMVGKKIGGLKNQIFINILAISYHLNEFDLFYFSNLWPSKLFIGKNLEICIHRNISIHNSIHNFYT